jgi:hypothetical protein
MRRPQGLAWAALCAWCLLVVALQGLCAASDVLGRVSPDLALVLVLALGARLSGIRADAAVLCVALSRVAFGADAPAALLAGYFGAAGLFRLAGRFVVVERAWVRAALAAPAALALAALFALAQSARLDDAEALALPFAWPSAALTALAAAWLAPTLGRLPGLSPLAARRGGHA